MYRSERFMDVQLLRFRVTFDSGTATVEIHL